MSEGTISGAVIGEGGSRYRVLERLGGGAMGVVYLGEDLRLGRTVALKFLPREWSADATARRRFLVEARAASALDHPNICAVHDIGETGGGRLFIVLQHCPGETLKKKIERGPLPLADAIRYAGQLAAALSSAHAAGITHRDVKPANVMVTLDGSARLLDFGLAKLAGDAALTDRGLVVGTLPYMAPEQARGDIVDARADIWSFGVTLFEMLAGRRPFADGVSPTAALTGRSPVPSVRQLRPDVPAEIDDLLGRCLEPRKERRAASMADIQEVLSALETTDRPRTTVASLRRVRSRFRRAGLVAILAAMAAATVVWQQWTAADLPRARHLLVLPFTEVGDGEPTLGTGLMETLTSAITQLQRFHGELWVVPAADVRESGIFSAEQARRTFGVNLAVTGSVQRSAGAVRLTLNLVDAEHQRQLRAAVITQPADSTAALQDAASTSLAGMLDLELAPESRRALTDGGTRVTAAYDLYLRARDRLRDAREVSAAEEAVALLERAVALDPGYALAYATLADAHRLRHQLAGDGNAEASLAAAESAAHRAVALCDRLTPARITLALLLRDSGRGDAAVAELRQAVVVDPASFPARIELARTLERTGRSAAAETTLRDAVAARPYAWSGYSHLGDFLYRHGRFDEAAAMFERSVALAPDNPDNAVGYANLGAIHFARGDTERAATMLERSIAIMPTVNAYSNLATLRFYQGALERAAALYRQAIALDGDNEIAWGNLADTLRASGRTPEARTAYRHAVELVDRRLAADPGSPRLLESLALYRACLGEADGAVEALARARAAAPDDVGLMCSSVIVLELAGRRGEALAAVSAAVAAGIDPHRFDDEPDLAGLRADPAYPEHARIPATPAGREDSR